VGALSALLNIDPLVIAELIGEQYRGKEAAAQANLNALQLGAATRSSTSSARWGSACAR